MVEKRDGSQRRVYSLPTELVDRIVEFQNEKGYPSEVEAVRKLLDDALKSRDDYATIITRFLARLRELRMPSEVAKDILVGHPQIAELKFEQEAITFRMTNFYSITINSNGRVFIEDENGRSVPWPPKILLDQAPGITPPKFSRDLDDEIPF